MSIKINNGETVELFVQISNAGAGVTGETPTVEIQRQSDDNWYTGAAWQAGIATINLVEQDSTNLPGYYNYEWTNDGADTYRIHYVNTGTYALEQMEVYAATVQDANVTQIDAQDTDGNNATLNLKQLNIVNNAGSAIVATSSGSNGNGLHLTGNGSGAGLNIDSGTTGNGVEVQSNNQHAIYAIAAGGSGKSALYLDAPIGAGSGVGLYVSGEVGAQFSGSGPSAIGINVTSDNGSAFAATSSGGNGSGMLLTGNGTGHGIDAQGGGGATGNGINIESNSTQGNGIFAQGTGDKHGIFAQGEGGGSGAFFDGGESGPGLYAKGVNGIEAEGDGANSNGMLISGIGTGHGVEIVAGATGNGLDISAAGSLYAIALDNSASEDVLEQMYGATAGVMQLQNSTPASPTQIEMTIKKYDGVTTAKTRDITEPDGTGNATQLDATAMAGRS